MGLDLGILCGCATWSPRACHYDTLRRAHRSFLTRCIGWRKNNRADHPISYLDTLIKTGSESIEATLRKRWVLFTGFVARMETAEVRCSGNWWGARAAWVVRKKSGWGVSWTTSELLASTPANAQDEGEWRKTAEQGAERFMAKWIAADKIRARLRHAVCPNVT